MNIEGGDKKVLEYLPLMIKLIALIFAAGVVYGKLYDLNLVVEHNSDSITSLKLKDVNLDVRIFNLEREVYERRH